MIPPHLTPLDSLNASSMDFYLGPAIVVNSEESGVTGWGDANGSLIDEGVTDHGETQGDDYDTFTRGDQPVTLQLFQTGHTQNLVTEPSAEYGYGVGPERRLSHYPYADQPNPFRNHDAYGRWALEDGERYRPEVVAYWSQALGYELSQATVKQRSPVNPIVDQPPSQPFTDSLTPGGYYG